MKFSYISVLLFCTITFFSCHFANQEDYLDDPIEIYSIIKEDTITGIDVVTDGNNPMGIRSWIAQYEIPESSFESKRNTLYQILDSLMLLKYSENEDIYGRVDSLNYMAIHYMENLLKDKKSMYSPLKHRLLTVVTSPDKVLRIYSWNENNGTKFNTYLNVYQYLTKDKILLTAFETESYANKTDFMSGLPKNIYKLYSKTENDYYLLNMEGDISGDEHFKGSTILMITADSLIFNYNGFYPNERYLSMTYSEREKINTSYNYKNGALTYTIKTIDGESDTIQYIFNGLQFELKQD